MPRFMSGENLIHFFPVCPLHSIRKLYMVLLEPGKYIHCQKKKKLLFWVNSRIIKSHYKK